MHRRSQDQRESSQPHVSQEKLELKIELCPPQSRRKPLFFHCKELRWGRRSDSCLNSIFWLLSNQTTFPKLVRTLETIAHSHCCPTMSCRSAENTQAVLENMQKGSTYIDTNATVHNLSVIEQLLLLLLLWDIEIGLQSNPIYKTTI